MRTQLSAPVSLMVIVVGAALSYYVLHANGWSMSGDASLSSVYKSLPFQSRAVVILGFMLNAWGFGKSHQCAAGWKTKRSASTVSLRLMCSERKQQLGFIGPLKIRGPQL